MYYSLRSNQLLSSSKLVYSNTIKVKMTIMINFSYYLFYYRFNFRTDFTINPFPANVPIMEKPGRCFLQAKCMKNTYERVTF